MICYIDIEHERILQDPEERQGHLARRTDVKLRLEEISGQACLVQRYSRVTLTPQVAGLGYPFGMCILSPL